MPRKLLKTFQTVKDKGKSIGWKAPAALVGGYLGTSIAPKVMGYKNEEGDKRTLGAATALGAGTSAVSWDPDVALPRFAKKPLIDRIGRASYKTLRQRAPALGGAWGAVSGAASHEIGRAAKKGVDTAESETKKYIGNHNDKTKKANMKFIDKYANLRGMTYDPDNPKVKKYKKKYGDNYKEEMWKRQGGKGQPNVQKKAGYLHKIAQLLAANNEEQAKLLKERGYKTIPQGKAEQQFKDMSSAAKSRMIENAEEFNKGVSRQVRQETLGATPPGAIIGGLAGAAAGLATRNPKAIAGLTAGGAATGAGVTGGKRYAEIKPHAERISVSDDEIENISQQMDQYIDQRRGQLFDQDRKYFVAK